MDNQTAPTADGSDPRWKPLSAVDRRVAGVLVEKAKTTPDQYPLTVNALSTGANQKSNRFPLMQLEPDDIEESLERLRALGAVLEVQGSGRVARYRHLMYEWLGVEKVELAVMAELLLRGAQTVGELRGRAARMEPISDLAALRPHLATLKAKRLIEYLTPEGRGCVVTHCLYPPDQREQLRAQYAGFRGAAERVPTPAESPVGTVTVEAARTPTTSAGQPADTAAGTSGQIELLQGEMRDLRAGLDALREQLQAHCQESSRVLNEVRKRLGMESAE